MAKKQVAKKEIPCKALMESTPKKAGKGGVPRGLKDLSHFVRWPLNIRLQRKRAILLKKLKVPPAINQFRFAANKSQAIEVLRLLSHYRPESPADKKERLTKEAESRAAGKEPTPVKRPETVTIGLDAVTKSIEQKKARLVVIAHDVDPIEMVCWLPTLCRKMQVPYVIIKGKGRLGALVHQKKCSTVALTSVKPEHKSQLDNLVKVLAPEFIDNQDVLRKWGN